MIYVGYIGWHLPNAHTNYPFTAAVSLSTPKMMEDFLMPDCPAHGLPGAVF
jgi:hypothetical protein